MKPKNIRLAIKCVRFYATTFYGWSARLNVNVDDRARYMECIDTIKELEGMLNDHTKNRGRRNPIRKDDQER